MDRPNVKILPIYLFSIFLIISAWFLLGLASKVENKSSKIEINDNCSIRVNGNLYENIPIGKISFKAPKKNSTIKIEIKLPDYVNSGWSCGINPYLCSVEAYIDGRNVYSYGLEEIKKGKMVGSGYHFIPLPENCATKTLFIILKMGEDNTQTSLKTPFLVRSEHLCYTITDGQTPVIFISAFFLVFGLCLLILSPFTSEMKNILISLVALGTFLISVGLWSISTTKILQIFYPNHTTLTTIEYFSLYFAPFPVSLIAMNFGNEVHGKNTMKFVKLCCKVSGGFFVISCFLHFTNLVHAPNLLIPFHLLSLMETVFVICITVRHKTKELSAPYKMLLVSFLTVVTTIILEISRFNIQKYFFPNSTYLLISLFTFGLLVFMIEIFASLLMIIYEKFIIKTKNEQFEYFAYHDVLTGFLNSRKWTEEVDYLNSSDNDYAIISIDMNGLKSINDTLGHKAGNTFIKAYSDILKKAFRKTGKIFRTGGDEFTVSIVNPVQSIVDQCLINLKHLQMDVSKDSAIKLSSSYGVAYREEILRESDEVNADKVFNLADKRMYRMKKEFHMSHVKNDIN